VVLARPGAYMLRAPEERIDIRRFERLAAQGRRALEDGAPDRAAVDLREALALWRGAPLSDVSQERFVTGTWLVSCRRWSALTHCASGCTSS